MAGMLGDNDVARAIANQADRMQRQVVNLLDAAREKMKLNALKYPVEKSRGSAKKYSEI
jgi:two-component system sensor histidine kinase KdpD